MATYLKIRGLTRNASDDTGAVYSGSGFRVRSAIGQQWPHAGTTATLTTSLTGSNNDLVYSAAYPGAFGNNISVAYVTPGTNNAVLGVVISYASGTANPTITVNLATNGSAAITSTAAQIKAAVLADPVAGRLVTIANAASNDGTGVVTALSSTPLASGANGTASATNVGQSIELPVTGLNTVVVDLDDAFTLRQLYRMKGRWVSLGQT